MKTLKKFNKYSKQFHDKGFVIVKNFFKKSDCEKAAKWLQSQNQKKFAKTWTEQEPNVPLAIYFSVHKYDTLISKLAKDKSLLNFASKLMKNKVYLYSSKVNLKAAWCGTVEYFHQDMVYWKSRGYRKDDMLSVMTVLEPQNIHNAALHVFPKSHKLGLIKHDEFFNTNGLSKFMIGPKKLDKLKKKCGVAVINGKPGDVVFFHASLVHGSSHNISPNGRMALFSWFNSQNNLPKNASKKAKLFNLTRAKKERHEAQRRLKWYRKKYKDQQDSTKLTFSASVAKEEKN